MLAEEARRSLPDCRRSERWPRREGTWTTPRIGLGLDGTAGASRAASSLVVGQTMGRTEGEDISEAGLRVGDEEEEIEKERVGDAGEEAAVPSSLEYRLQQVSDPQAAVQASERSPTSRGTLRLEVDVVHSARTAGKHS